MKTIVSPTVKQQEISPVDALWVLIKRQGKSVRKALAQRILDDEYETQAQQTMVKHSLTKAFDELHSGQTKHNARALFDS